jgi:hypothetical protein
MTNEKQSTKPKPIFQWRQKGKQTN